MLTDSLLMLGRFLGAGWWKHCEKCQVLQVALKVSLLGDPKRDKIVEAG